MLLPDYIDKDAWEGFADMRKTIKKPMTLKELSQRLSYAPESGHFTRLKKRRSTDSDRADIINKRLGYMVVSVDKQHFYAHRLAWLFAYGEWPPFEIDHINGVRHDNRIENLRQATREENCGNVVHRAGVVGLFGVTKQSNTKKFRSAITVNSKRKHLGYFDTPMEAHLTALKALDRYRGEFSPAQRITGVA